MTTSLDSLRRKRALRGFFKSLILPRGVVFVVHKPRYAETRSSVEAVYKHYGIVPIFFKPMRLTRDMVEENYAHVFRKKERTDPEHAGEFKKKLTRAYSAAGLEDNVAVEFLHVPAKAVKAVDAKNVWDAIKKIGGKTFPREAAAEMKRTGLPSIRGRAFQDAPTIVTGMYNVVHIPDSSRWVVEHGHLTGRYTDLDLFASRETIREVRKKVRELKKARKIA